LPVFTPGEAIVTGEGFREHSVFTPEIHPGRICRRSEFALPIAPKPELVKEARALLSAPAAERLERISKMYNPSEYLFYKIVQKANDSEFWYRTADFVQFHEFKIQRVGIVLQFLGLAQQTDNGWAANYHLMTIIAEQLARPSRQNSKVKATQEDREVLHAIYELAMGFDLDSCDDGDEDIDEEIAEEIEAANWCWNVLAALGFVKKRLRRLFTEKLQS
jgi:hypothetical protein